MKTDERASLGWQVFEETNDAVFVTTDDNRICEVNPFAQRMTGLSRSELVGRHLFELLSSPEREIEDVIEALSHTGIFHSREAYQLMRQTGPPITVNVSVSRIHTLSGTFGVIIARDISDRAESERKLREAHDLLEERVAQRTSELEEANRRLSEANEQLKAAQAQAIKQEQLRIAGQIASGMAHDINNSVAPIANFADSLLSDPSLSKAQQEQLRHIRTGAEDIAATVRRLQELRPVSGQRAHRVISMKDILESVGELTRSQWHDDAKRRGVNIELRIDEFDSVEVEGNESALRSVLMNLVFNAIDAIEHSGNITITCRRVDTQAVIEVRDDGEGMDESQISNCTEPFVTSREHGCGLGLSLSQKIVRQHHGTLSITSRPGHGTTVTVRLPAAGETSADVEEPSNPQPKWKILLVDDDDLVRKSTLILFQTKGLDVDVAASGPEALQLLRDSQYGVVISDLLLGEMNGLDLLRECRRLQPDLHTVLTTGWIGGVGEEVDESIVDAAFQKPIEFDRLLATLAEFETRSTPLDP